MSEWILQKYIQIYVAGKRMEGRKFYVVSESVKSWARNPPKTQNINIFLMAGRLII